MAQSDNWRRQILSRKYAVLMVLSVLDLFAGAYYLISTAQGRSIFETVIVFLLLSILTIIIGIAWNIVLRSRREFMSRPARYLFMSVWIVLFAGIITTPFTYWPMRLAFAIQRPQFERLAYRVRHGEIPNKPECIGLYTVTKFELKPDGTVGLWTCPEGDRCIGFVTCRSADVQFHFGDYADLAELAGNWQFIEDWD